MTNRVGPVDAVSGAPSYTGRALRQLGSVSLAGATSARPLGARSGVRPGTPASTVSVTTTQYTVGNHAGVLDLAAANEAGAYEYSIDVPVVGTLTAATSFIRIDILSVTPNDPAESLGSGGPSVGITYTQGTVASTQPATPSGSMLVAIITSPASGGGAPTVQWVAPILQTGIIPVRNLTERNLITWGTAENPAYVDRLDLGILQRSVASGTWSSASIGPWTTYTPTLTNLSVGTGTISCQWRYEGDLIRVRFAFTIGTGSAMNSPQFSLPVAATALPQTFVVAGHGSLAIIGARYAAAPSLANTTTAQINYLGANGLLSNITLAAPATWNVGDILAGELTYRWN